MGTVQRPDQQLVYFKRFDLRLREHIRSLISDKLIEEHRASPMGLHSDALARVQDYFRKPPKFGLYSRCAGSYELIALPVVPGEVPKPLDDQVYTDEISAAHIVFLAHVNDLMQG